MNKITFSEAEMNELAGAAWGCWQRDPIGDEPDLAEVTDHLERVNMVRVMLETLGASEAEPSQALLSGVADYEEELVREVEQAGELDRPSLEAKLRVVRGLAAKLRDAQNTVHGEDDRPLNDEQGAPSLNGSTATLRLSREDGGALGGAIEFHLLGKLGARVEDEIGLTAGHLDVAKLERLVDKLAFYARTLRGIESRDLALDFETLGLLDALEAEAVALKADDAGGHPDDQALSAGHEARIRGIRERAARFSQLDAA